MIPGKLSPPEAVRVWRGFKTPLLSQADFFKRLSTVFVPATVEMQTKIGLDTYIPTIPCGMENKPATVPDETAILYWNSQDTYHDGFKTLAVRTYTLTHGAVYTKESRADFPLLYSGNLISNQPYFLIDQPADWMLGDVQHLIGGPLPNQSLSDFSASIESVITTLQSAGQMDGGVVCVGPNYLVFWTLNDRGSAIESLLPLVGWKVVKNSNSTSLQNGLWDQWPGMDINPGDSFNMQFNRNSTK